MSMERANWGWNSFLLFISLFLSLLQLSLSSDLPSQGCYWTETCLHRWKGDCGGLVYNQSSDCLGRCQSPEYSPCPPDHTHFYCCVAGSPRQVNGGCAKCEKKEDDGDEFVCCDDCTYPEMVYNDSSSGYCKSGAELISQPKPKGVQMGNRAWLPCSSSCGGGVRSRRVECFAVVEDTSSPDYPVYDDRCSDQEKPIKQEPCNLQRCVDNAANHDGRNQRRKQKTSTWKIALLVLLGLVAIGGIGFAGFILYRRRTDGRHGYVYVMMGEYS